jgi:hypothetical protein
MFNRFTTKDSYTWNITHNTNRISVWNLRPEPWGSPLVEEAKYQEEKACDRRHNDNDDDDDDNGDDNNNYCYYFYNCIGLKSMYTL